MPYLCLLLLLPSADVDSPIKSDEAVTFFNTPAHFDKQQKKWIASVHGWIYEPEYDSRRRLVALAAFARALDVADDAAKLERFRDRAWPFLFDNERNKRVPVRIGAETAVMPKSDEMGHFRGNVTLEAGKIDKPTWRLLQAVTRPDDNRAFLGKVLLIPPEGLSVVSDIDDTIKISEVRNRRKLIANTFVLPFRPAPGMADLYRRWAKQGAVFHYVSASPWQLYPALAKFAAAEKFPAGTWHMKDFRATDERVANLFADPIAYKKGRIEPLLKAYPDRKFLLVGDSGEKDPEIYAALARKYPDQIKGVYIRNVTDEPADAPRYRATFKGIDAKRWHIFDKPGDLE